MFKRLKNTFGMRSLEKVVDALFELPKKSKELSNKINELNLSYKRKDGNLTFNETYTLGYVNLDKSTFDVNVKIKLPSYELTRRTELYLSLGTKSPEINKVRKEIGEFIDFHLDQLLQIHHYEELNSVEKYESVSEYVSAFEQAISSYNEFSRKYTSLRERGYIKGGELRFTASLDFDKLINPIAKYVDYLKQSEEFLRKEDLVFDSDVNTVLDQIRTTRKHFEKVVNKYNKIKEKNSELVTLLKEGINFAEYPYRSLMKPVAKLLYKIKK